MDILTSPQEVHNILCTLPEIAGQSFCDAISMETLQEAIKNFSDYISIAMKARGAGPFIPVVN